MQKQDKHMTGHITQILAVDAPNGVLLLYRRPSLEWRRHSRKDNELHLGRGCRQSSTSFVNSSSVPGGSLDINMDVVPYKLDVKKVLAPGLYPIAPWHQDKRPAIPRAA